LSLPSRKPELPVRVYLDQNKWIDLACASNARPGSERFAPALTAVRAAAKNGSAIFPMSAVHVMETMAPEDEGRRRRTATFMVELSRNLSISPHTVLRPIEILHAIKRLYGLPIANELRPFVVREGLAAALGCEIELHSAGEHREDLERIARSAEMSIELLVSAGDREAIREARRQDEAMVAELEARRLAARQAMSEEMKRRVEIAELFLRGVPGGEARSWLGTLGISEENFFSKMVSPEKWDALVEDIPTLNTWLTLMMERDHNPTERVHRNDTKDLGFLAVAIPYCNVVVTERAWASRVRRSGLAQKYETIVCTDVADLPDVLRDLGCSLDPRD
jgi:hypothetical protein